MSTTTNSVDDSRWPHRWAWLLAATTFPLIWWGGYTTTTDAGMAFRDWITSDGHFMLIYPWFESTGAKFIEHGHRLLAVLVGILTISLAIVTHRCESRIWVRRYSLILLAGVIAQGMLGGARILMDERLVAMLHGCTGPLFFAMTTAMVVFTSRWWTEQNIEYRGERLSDKSLARLAILCCGLAYGQLVVGAVVRHTRYLTSASAASIFQLAVYFHVILAFVVLGHVMLLAAKSILKHVHRGHAIFLSILVLAQIGLGLATWFVRFGVPAWLSNLIGEVAYVNVSASNQMAMIITGHVAAGSLIVAVSLATALRAIRESSYRLPQLGTSRSKQLEAAL